MARNNNHPQVIRPDYIEDLRREQYEAAQKEAKDETLTLTDLAIMGGVTMVGLAIGRWLAK